MMKILCLLSKLETALLNLAPGQLIFIDFSFISEPSFRGFHSYLSFTKNSTGFAQSFPTRNKRPLMDLICFLILNLRMQDKSVNFILFDKGGELACLSEINKLLQELMVLFQTNFCHVSHLNKDKSSHRTINKMVCCQLYTNGLSNVFC